VVKNYGNDGRERASVRKIVGVFLPLKRKGDPLSVRAKSKHMADQGV
jgi:hypothetical protein